MGFSIKAIKFLTSHERLHHFISCVNLGHTRKKEIFHEVRIHGKGARSHQMMYVFVSLTWQENVKSSLLPIAIALIKLLFFKTFKFFCK